MIEKRQAAFIKYGKDSPVYRLWRDRVRGDFKTAKHNKVDGLAETNPKKWWHDITV